MKARGRWIIGGGGVLRPCRLAAGMSRTGYRARGRMGDEARRLSVYGTLDPLAGLLNWNVKRSPRVCPCCGQRVAAFVLSDSGRRRLRALRGNR